jgi:DNA-binding CsgD family transcriptional regulator
MAVQTAQRVTIVSRSPLIRAAWAAFVRECPGLHLASATSPDPTSFLTAGGQECDVVLAVACAPGAFTQWIRSSSNLRVICLGGARKNIPKGAVWMGEDTDPAALLDTLRGRVGCARRTNPGKAVTDREREVLDGICAGLSLKAIGAQGGQTTSTIETQLRRIMKKLGVTTRSALVLEAAARGWTSCPCQRARS